MSEKNVEIVRRLYEGFWETGDFPPELIHPDVVWDFSKFRGRLVKETYLGVEGVREFLAEWSGTWDDWEVELEELLDAGEKVVAIERNRGRSKGLEVPVEWQVGVVLTLADGKLIRSEFYASPHEAL
ncbi:MAG: nuclear transport factor 2 family protein, partial [Solirubrobacterales bacterium]